ncbi:MAG: ABC transporter substrate-binding protein [Betaproteobacteria bacterium]
MKTWLCSLMSGAVLLSPLNTVIAQSYPSKSIRIIVPFSSGNTGDIVVRLIGQKLSESLGQQVVVDNRPGAGGIIGTEAGAKAAPDGYTILLGSNGTFGINPSLYSKLPYDPIKSFTPITHVGNVSYLLAVGNNLPVNSVKEFVAIAKADPGKRTLAHTASVSQLFGTLFQTAAGITLTPVPYKSLSEEFIDVSSGRVDALLETVTGQLSQVKAGRIKVLAVASAQRSPLLPEIPTIAESGYPGFQASGWVGFFAPAGTPKEFAIKLHNEFSKILRTSEIKEKLLQNGFEVTGWPPDQLAAIVKAEISTWEKVFKEANISRVN